ncbi:hypothetical protein YC2023_036619 [Brassica napus]
MRNDGMAYETRFCKYFTNQKNVAELKKTQKRKSAVGMEWWYKDRSPAQAILPHLSHHSLFYVLKNSSNGRSACNSTPTSRMFCGDKFNQEFNITVTFRFSK